MGRKIVNVLLFIVKERSTKMKTKYLNKINYYARGKDLKGPILLC